MTDTDRERAYVSDLYPGPKWKKKVKQMPDDQIIAIYLKHQSDGQPPEHSEHDEPEPKALDLETEPKPERLVDVPRGRGPHANEDQFPIY